MQKLVQSIKQGKSWISYLLSCEIQYRIILYLNHAIIRRYVGTAILIKPGNIHSNARTCNKIFAWIKLEDKSILIGRNQFLI